MKVAIYSICKNEEKFVARWALSAKNADLILLADTGSTDNTCEIAKLQDLNIKLINIKVDPWRFDVARNLSLDAIPTDYDYCIALDVDEIILPGWRKELERIMMFENKTTRPLYKYVYSWNNNGIENLTHFYGCKIHTRQNYVWMYPVHETLKCTNIETRNICNIEIHHSDLTKKHGNYIELLALGVKENPNDDRCAYYYARELYSIGKNNDAIVEFKRHLNLPNSTWRAERAYSMLYLADLEPQEKETWLLRACAETPDRREPWVKLSAYYYSIPNWEGCLWASKKSIQIKDKPLEYLCEDYAWGYAPYDYAALSSYYMKLYSEALQYGKEALQLCNDNQRLIKNLEFYKTANIPSPYLNLF